jgi:hypothetical protein
MKLCVVSLRNDVDRFNVACILNDANVKFDVIFSLNSINKNDTKNLISCSGSSILPINL